MTGELLSSFLRPVQFAILVACLLTDHFLASQRTLSPLQFPPHVVAVACINLAALLSSFEKGPTQAQPGCASDHQIAAMLRTHGPWERKFQAQVEDLERQSDLPRLPSESDYTVTHVQFVPIGTEVIAHALLDLLIAAAQNPSASASPSTPSSPSAYSPYPHSSRNNALNPSSSNPHIPPQPSPCPYNSDQLIRLKISLRESEHKPRERTALFGDVRSSGGGGGEAMKKGGMGGAGGVGQE